MALLQADYRADAVARQRRGKKSHKSQPAFNMEVVRGVAGQVYGQMKFVGCITGKFAGFSPLRILPAYIAAWR
jgi:hypothetical protein